MTPSYHLYNCHGQESSGVHGNVISGVTSISSQCGPKYTIFSYNIHVTDNRSKDSAHLVSDKKKLIKQHNIAMS